MLKYSHINKETFPAFKNKHFSVLKKFKILKHLLHFKHCQINFKQKQELKKHYQMLKIYNFSLIMDLVKCIKLVKNIFGSI